MRRLQFLQEVWGDREGYVDIPAKTNGRWIGAVSLWPTERDGISRRIRSSLRDGEDLYFTPAQFSNRRRDAEGVRPTHWLWADLDTVEPSVLERLQLRPTVCWSSSPGRYQALWRLDRELNPRIQEQLNRALTYTVGADRGGWDLTQVLRIPGTRNFKYNGSDGVPVKLLWTDGPVYSPKELYKRLKELGRAVQPTPRPPSARDGRADGGGGRSPKKVLSKRIPTRAKRLLNTKPEEVVQGERSARLWELECLLLEAGYSQAETFELVEPCAWNKWRDLRSGVRRLQTEIRKAANHVRATQVETASEALLETTESDRFTVVEPEPEHLPFINYADFMAKDLPTPSWMIEDIWTENGHGFVGGEPKSSKSTICLAAGVAVASGKPFLGHYRVFGQGPVICIQEENEPSDVQDKLRKIAYHSGLIHDQELRVTRAKAGALGHKAVYLDLPDDIPFFLLNNWGFDLSNESHREMLQRAVEQIRPALVILDPLYLLVGGANTDRMQEMVPYLKWLLALKFEYGCAIQVVHHYKKMQQGAASGGGQRLMGSGAFHGWLSSALYSEAMEENRPSYIRLQVGREFRSMPPMPPLEISMKMGKPGSLVFSPEVREFDLGAQVVAFVEQNPGVSATALAEELGVDKRTALARARGTGKLRVDKGKQGRGYTHRIWPAGYREKEK